MRPGKRSGHRPPEGPDDGPGNQGPPVPSDAAEQLVDVAGGRGARNGGQRPGLRCRGTRVETHAGNATGGRDR